ncbi:MAG: hypothetical protein ACOX4U_01070 [Anaerovoracaceae bacterium]|jgi:hypothetical protein
MRKGKFYDEDYGYEDEMLSVAAHCSRFIRRRDVNMFNMTNYRSCENCGHMSPDGQCGLRLDSRFTGGTME